MAAGWMETTRRRTPAIRVVSAIETDWTQRVPKPKRQKRIAAPGKVVGLTRIHLEEDVAKSTHMGSGTAIDFNRAASIGYANRAAELETNVAAKATVLALLRGRLVANRLQRM